jgi:hypothetical protein
METAKPLIYRVASDSDLESSKKLLDDNYRGSLADDELKDGFISIQFTIEELIEMSQNGITIIALSGVQATSAATTETAGVLFTQTCEYNVKKVPFAARMIDALEGKTLGGSKIEFNESMVCGPVCISKEFRGQGIFPKLYELFRNEAKGKFSTALTLVAQSNLRSQRAHEKVGFEKLNSFDSNGRAFDAFAMRL